MPCPRHLSFAHGLWLLLASASTLHAQQDLFPFLVSYDAPQNATNVGTWTDQGAVAVGPVRVQDGTFRTDHGRLKLWAVNFCFGACFPDQEEAERVARRLARFGINCVRMHHMDARDIWGNSENKTIIDPDQLRRLDYLIYQLKRQGIYTNLNLHVSRTLGESEGFAHQDERPKYDKGLDNFEPRMIELQKKYARDLLAHVNPFTGLAYTEDPAIAFVEINNENALYHSWHRGALNDLPSSYKSTLQRLWNSWLRRKYGTSDALRAAWESGAVALGSQMLVNGDFSQPLEVGWNMETDSQTDVQWERITGGPTPTRRQVLSVTVHSNGSVSWRPQFSHDGIALKKGKPYTLTFCAKADRPQQISVHTMMNHEPWRRLGLSAQVDLGPRYRQYRLAFVASEEDTQARVTFSQLQPGHYEFLAVSLRPGGVHGLRETEGLDRDRVPLLIPGRMDRTPAVQHDFAQFLWDTEQEYWGGMYRFLKQDLGTQALVSGTQLGYSPVHLQAELDYLDAHAYWQHPSFPGRPWDRDNWNVHNIALVNHFGGTLASLAARRVVGKPYTISEYNHPAPNSFAAEGFPMIAAYGALQDWDGIYAFAYSHSNDFEPRMVSSFFDIKADPTRLVHLPACYALFVRGDVAAAEQSMVAPISRDDALARLSETFDPADLVADRFGVDSRFSLEHRIGVALTDSSHARDAAGIARNDSRRYVSDTSQLVWDAQQQSGGFWTASTPRTKVFSGFVEDRAYTLGNVQLNIGETRLGWATLSMVCLDGPDFASTGRVLVAASGWMQNSNAQLQQLPGDRVTLGSRWGNSPVLCEGIPASITLPVRAELVQCYALDERGERRRAVGVSADGDRAIVRLSPDYQTLWYEIVIQ